VPFTEFDEKLGDYRKKECNQKGGERWGVTICKFESRLRATSGTINTFKVTIVTVPANPK
jgi:hypothetical protein